MTKGSNDEGADTAKISVSTGTTGGGESAASDDDPPDTETFQEDVDFDINYQQNGRVTGIATDSEEPMVGRGKRSERRRSSTTSRGRHHHSRRYRIHLRRGADDRHTTYKKRRQLTRRQTRHLKHRARKNLSSSGKNARKNIRSSRKNMQSSRKNIRSSRKNVKNKKARETDRQSDIQRDKEEDDDADKDKDRDRKDKDEYKRSELERYSDYLVKKDLNDYFAPTENAANDEEEVFDRSDRASKSHVSQGNYSVAVSCQV